MAKRKSSPYMSPGEQIAGTVFFVIYLVVLPFATAPLFRLAERLLAVSTSPLPCKTPFITIRFSP